MAQAVRAAMPGAYVCLSSEVLPQIKEYDRVCTTVVNAYVGPALQRYLTRLEGRLREAGFAGPVLIIQSHGGVATIADAVALSAGAVLSGPAGGVAGSCHAATLMGHGDLIPFDMGGTSTDISLVVGGHAAIASDRRLAGQRVALQSLDIASIGAGGGSIARVDAGGVLHVGPESAGAQPGPACYGRGGTEATVDGFQPGAGVSPIPTISSAGGRSWIGRRPRRRWTGWRRSWGWTGWRPPRVSIASSTRAWPRASGWFRCDGGWIRGGSRSCRSGGGGAACDRRGAAARFEARDRAAAGRGAVGLGTLASDIRDQHHRADPYSGRREPAGGGAVARSVGGDGGGGAGQAGGGRVRRARGTQRSADMRYGEQIFEVAVPLDGIDFARPDLPRRWRRRFMRGMRNSTPTRCRTRRRCW